MKLEEMKLAMGRRNTSQTDLPVVGQRLALPPAVFIQVDLDGRAQYMEMRPDGKAVPLGS